MDSSKRSQLYPKTARTGSRDIGNGPQPRVPAKRIASTLLKWADEGRRQFPWRTDRSQWRRLVAEVLLQRTRADSVALIWPTFWSHYPDPQALSKARLDHLANLVSPLGLAIKRSSALRALARRIVALGGVPKTVDALTSLPGVGDYSANAWLVSTGHPSRPPVDANVRRVLGRLVYGDGNIGSDTAREVFRRVDAYGPSRDLLFAILDLGNSPCRPRRPLCAKCPASKWCRFATELAESH